MKNQTRALFTAYISHIALLNGGIDASTKFAVDPVVEQKLEEVIKESSEFLQKITVTPVTQQKGEVLGLLLSDLEAETGFTRAAGAEQGDDAQELAPVDLALLQLLAELLHAGVNPPERFSI